LSILPREKLAGWRHWENNLHPAGWGNTDDEESIRAIHTALDLGVTFFDTAANYGAGHSEVVLGRALKGKREDVVIATKFGHIVKEEKKTVYGDATHIIKNVRTDVENSLRRLQTDFIDIYQLHDSSYDPKLPLELQSVLEELVSVGKIRWSARILFTERENSQTEITAHLFNSD